MKKNTSKKGFTIVELVIVIAVIAILSAVLIPTFASVTKNAEKANDTVLARNLNTAAISASADDFDEALEAAQDAGYLISNLNAKADNCFFVWEEDSNQFLLYDMKEDKVIYANTNDYGELDSSWCFAISNPAVAASVKTTLAEKNVTVKQTVASVKHLNAWLANGGTQTIYIDESFVVDTNSTINVVDGADITLILSNSTLSTNGAIKGAPIAVENANLTVKGGAFNCAGIAESIYGKFFVTIGYEPGVNLEIDSVTFTGKTAINGTWLEDGEVHMTVNNCTMDMENSGVVMSPGPGTESTAEVNNCTINAGDYALLASQSGTMTVNGGTYKGGLAVIHVQTASTVIVNGGTFDGILSISGGTLTINAGTFKNTGLTFEAFEAYVAAGKTATENADGSFTVA